MTLLPGDVILTGTPAGIAPMPAGSTITVAIDGLGALTNKVSSRG
jgi:2-keto-4-pentenoate hydratase/2-oxohepta-3-ene-1,7-dioic acid hydratase in catechol pathway